MKKKLFFLLSMLVCMLAVTSCAKVDDASSHFTESQVKEAADALLKNFTTSDFSTITDKAEYDKVAYQYGKEEADRYVDWYETLNRVGAFVSADDYKFTYSTDENDAPQVMVTITTTFEKESLLFKPTFNYELQPVDIVLDSNKSFGDKMVDALLNTVLGMGTVFIVLIFISLIISLLKYVPMLFEGKKPETVTSVVTEQAIYEEEAVNLIDDTELVAVITAAIMASRGAEASADGLMVRSIRKVNRKWKNA